MNDTTARLEAVERALHEVLTVDELGGAPLALLEDALGSSQSLLYAYGFQGQPLMLGGRLRERALADYGPEIFLRDPLHPYMRAKSPRFLLRPDGHTHEEVARSDAYAAFYGPAEADHYLGIWPTSLPYGAPGMFGVFLARSRRSGTFDDRALDVLTRLEPAFRVMARRVARVARLERDRAALLAAAGEPRGPRAATLVWDALGRLHASADVVSAWLAECRLTPATLWATAQNLLSDWRRHVRGPSRWERRYRGPEAELSVSFAIREDVCLAEPLIVAIVERVPHALARARDLTPAERRVLGELARGLRNADIADELGVSLDTVKTHVKHVLAKLGVASRAEAALLGATLDD